MDGPLASIPKTSTTVSRPTLAPSMPDGEFSMDYRLRRSDGEYRWVVDSGAPRFASNGAFLGYIGSAIDITERRLAEEEARDLSGRLMHAPGAERTRLARELHDDLSQSLALLSVELEMFGKSPPAERGQVSGRMQEFSAQVKRFFGSSPTLARAASGETGATRPRGSDTRILQGVRHGA